MTTKETIQPFIEKQKFTADGDFRKLVSGAIIKAAKRKETGADKAFSEALGYAHNEAAELLTNLWQRCNELKTTLRLWDTAVLVPLHKKGPEKEPKSYRPKAFLSHCRNIIGAAITKRINAEYSSNENQLEFQYITGTETTILRHLAS